MSERACITNELCRAAHPATSAAIFSRSAASGRRPKPALTLSAMCFGELVAGNGDEYNELYVGFNYYWYGHKLKLQTGLQQVDMDDVAADGGAHEGWSWTTGFRISW